MKYRLVLYLDHDFNDRIISDGKDEISGKQLIEQVDRAVKLINAGKAYKVSNYLDGLYDFLSAFDKASPPKSEPQKFLRSSSWASEKDGYEIVQDGMSYCLSFDTTNRRLIFEAYEEE